MVISWISTSLSVTDMSFSQEEIPDAMYKVGFKTVQNKPCPHLIGGTLDMVIGRKE